MKQLTKDELTELVHQISKEVTKPYIQNVSKENSIDDIIDVLAGNISQIQLNCENIIIEVLDKILND